MAADHEENQAQTSEAAARTEEALRLIKAFRALDSQAVREALIVLAEHLGAVKNRLQ
jgi:hypothetical protein